MPLAPLAAQVRPIVIQDATVLTGDGKTIPRCTVAFKGGKITAVGPRVAASLLAKKIPADGKYVTPGLIDACGTPALRSTLGQSRATGKAADAFDPYAEQEIKAALRAGVTATYLPARCASGIGGLGAVIRLIPRPTGQMADLVLSDETALCAAVGADGRQGPLARLKVAEELRKRFQAAQDYRTAWEDYEENLKEYEKKLAERAKKETEKEQKKPKRAGAGNKKAPPPNEKKPDKNKDGKKQAKKDELKKPAEPKKDRNAELLLRVIDGELPLRVEAHHPADILNVLDIAEEFNLALILEGAGGAHLVADRLAELEVPVVLTAAAVPLRYVSGTGRYAQPDAAAILRKAGVDVYFGSGALPAATAGPRLALRAARAVGYGFDPDDALETITYRAARLLRVDKEIGRVRRGLKADLVIWSDHPLAPGATVERVFVDGHEVFRAEADEDRSK